MADFVRMRTAKGTIMSINANLIQIVSKSPTINMLMMDLATGASIEVHQTKELLEMFGLKGDDAPPILKMPPNTKLN